MWQNLSPKIITSDDQEPNANALNDWPISTQMSSIYPNQPSISGLLKGNRGVKELKSKMKERELAAAV